MGILSGLLERNPALFRAARGFRYRVKGLPEPEMRLLPWLVDPERTALDIGAHRGAYVSELLKLCADIVAVEPIPVLADFTQRLYPKVRVVRAVASDLEGELELRIPDIAWGLASAAPENRLSNLPGKTIKVPATTIDRLATAPVGFIKIDVEGHELSVLRGGFATLERDRPVLLIEAEERHHPDAVASIRALLEPLGYQGLFLDEGRLVSIRNFDVARDQGFTEADEAALLRDSKIGRRYINNFIFIA